MSDSLSKILGMVNSQQAIYDEWVESPVGQAACGLGHIVSNVINDAELADTAVAQYTLTNMVGIEANSMHEDIASNYTYATSENSFTYLNIKPIADEQWRKIGHQVCLEISKNVNGSEQAIVSTLMDTMHLNSTSPNSMSMCLGRLNEALTIMWAVIYQRTLNEEGQLEFLASRMMKLRNSLEKYAMPTSNEVKQEQLEIYAANLDYCAAATSALYAIFHEGSFLPINTAKEWIQKFAAIEITDNPDNNSLGTIMASCLLQSAYQGSEYELGNHIDG